MNIRTALVVIALLALSAPAHAAITFVTGTGVSAGSANANDVTTGAVDTTSATLIVCVMSSYEAGTQPVITDSKSNTWQTDTTIYESATSSSVEIVYTRATSVGSGHTFTATGTGSAPTISCASFAGSHASAGFDQENGATNLISSSIATGSITPTENNELVIAGVTWFDNLATASINESMTIAGQTDNSPGNHMGGGIAYKIQTTATAINPTWTTTAGNNHAAAIASFKEAAAGGGGGPAAGSLNLIGVGR